MAGLRIGIIGDRDESFRPHWVTEESLREAARALSAEVSARWLPTRALEEGDPDAFLADFDAFWCSPGSPYRSLRGALRGLRCARESGKPLIGTCAGFQHILLEYACNVLGWREARSTQYDLNAAVPLITQLQCPLTAKTLVVRLLEGSLARRAYGREEIREFFYCRFGLNPLYRRELEEAGLLFSGFGEEGEPRVVELPGRRFFLATLFVPGDSAATSSKPVTDGHPLVKAFLQAALAERRQGSPTASRAGVA